MSRVDSSDPASEQEPDSEYQPLTDCALEFDISPYLLRRAAARGIIASCDGEWGLLLRRSDVAAFAESLAALAARATAPTAPDPGDTSRPTLTIPILPAQLELSATSAALVGQRGTINRAQLYRIIEEQYHAPRRIVTA